MSTAEWKVTLQELLSSDLLTAVGRGRRAGIVGLPVSWILRPPRRFCARHARQLWAAGERFYRYLQQLYMALSGPLLRRDRLPFKLFKSAKVSDAGEKRRSQRQHVQHGRSHIQETSTGG